MAEKTIVEKAAEAVGYGIAMAEDVAADNMVEMIRRGNGFRDLASKQAVEHAIMAGRGNVDLLLTQEQYERLVG
jgi:hypothetical protein